MRAARRRGSQKPSAQARQEARAERPRVLVVHRSASTFVRQDLDLLSETDSGVAPKSFTYEGKRSLRALSRAVAKSDVVLAWFALDHAAAAVWLARLHGKPSIVIAGGPGLIPAAVRKQVSKNQLVRERIAARYALKRADRVLAVSEAAFARVRHVAPSAQALCIPNAVDTQRFAPGNETQRERLVLMVAPATTRTRYLKGIDMFASAAAKVQATDPQVRFELVGPFDAATRAVLKQLAPKLDLLGRLGPEGLVARFQRASVVCQLSAFEAFGLPVAEGMACGCVPVVTDAGALPEIVGDLGESVPYGDAEAAAEAIRRALAAKPEVRDAVRARVEAHYTLEQRRRALPAAIRAVLEAS